MNAASASLINAIALIGLGLWGYFASETPSNTAFIPVGIGAALLLLNQGVRKENKVLAHIAVVLTLVALLGLAMAMKGSIERGNNMAIMRVAVMIATTILAKIYFIKSFRDARKARESQSS